MNTIYEKLVSYSNSDYYGFHMPGHKRNLAVPGEIPASRIDITEIEGFDDLHHAEGLIRDAQDRAAALYGADETYFLVNGSTVGILSSILGTTNKGDQILVARTCHKSVYHAIYMNELRPVYLYPGFDDVTQLNTEILPEDVEKALEEHAGIRVVVIVSPTYDGVVSDVERIAQIVHRRGIPLIVDEAHGAHFGFADYFPQNSNRKGADLVIHSVHKTLPSLTQTALLHLNGKLIDREKVRMYLRMLQSSSPSYVLMASIDSCMDLIENKREELFFPYIDRLKRTRERLSKLCCLKMAEVADPLKIVLSVKDTGMTGRELYEILLHKYHLQMEMYTGTYVLALTSVGDTEEGFERLVKAAKEIDAELIRRTKDDCTQAGDVSFVLPRLPMRWTSSELAEKVKEYGETECVPWKDSAGYISMEYAYLYPPGVPIIVPGEEITREAATLLEWYEQGGYPVEGRREQGRIEVWKYGKDILYHG